jgi:hypothetical protein
MSFQAIVILWLSVLIITRNRKELSEIENRLINGVSVACAIAIPLLLSDYRNVFNWHVVRMGAQGGLIFCLSVIKFSEKKSKNEVAMEFVHILSMDLMGAVLFCSIWNEFDNFQIILIITLTLHLTILIMKEFMLRQEPKIQEWIFNLAEAIDKRTVRTVDDIHKMLSSALGTSSLVFLDKEYFRNFNLRLIKNYLKEKGDINIETLKKDFDDEGAQELIYILESHQMNHLFIINVLPFSMALTNTKAIKGTTSYDKEMKILKSFVTLLNRKEIL